MTRGVRVGDVVRVAATEDGRFPIEGVVEVAERAPNGVAMVVVRGHGTFKGRSQVAPASWVTVLRHAPGKSRRRRTASAARSGETAG